MMPQDRQPEKKGRAFDTMSSWLIVALIIIVVLLVVSNVLLLAGFVLQNRGVPLAQWFARSTATPTNTPGVVPTAPATPTPTAVQPTAVQPELTPTAVEPTATAVEPTATVMPPTETPVPPTDTPVPPTQTPVPPTQTPVPPTATPTPPPTSTPLAITDWKGEYWPNVSLQYNPTLVRNDKAPGGAAGIDFDWQQRSPASGFPADAFSVRWTRTVALDDGAYRFHALVDDGVRLWINGRLAIDAWADHNLKEFASDWMLAKGNYTLKVEYYERIGNARIRVWWEKMSSLAYPDWQGEYWPNRALSDGMALLRNDRHPEGGPGIQFNWGTSAPAPGFPVDDFSVRWTRSLSFDSAAYRFYVLADDGVRLWIDGQILIDKWQDQSATEFTADRTLAQGTHTIRVEYYDHAGDAQIALWWEKTSAAITDWKGEYWTNRDLAGDPTLIRNDKNADGTPGLNLNWGTNAPASGLPADNFSARWTRQVTFPSGRYRFSAFADDGVRIAVDGQWIIDQWHDATGQTYTAELSLSGAHQLKVEYFERGVTAAIRFSWQRIGD
ncbi:MAG: hypothetical protein JXM73_21255 [Anaerolineae bacterium]|nr:hypothetical protein [Anaerolineae bacterium]